MTAVGSRSNGFVFDAQLAEQRIQNYLGGFLTYRLYPFICALQKQGYETKCTIRGSVVPIALGLLQEPAYFNDFDVVVKVSRMAKAVLGQEPSEPISAAGIHQQFVLPMLTPKAHYVSHEGVFANYRLQNFAKYVPRDAADIDFTLCFPKNNLSSYADACSSKDGLELEVQFLEHGLFTLQLSQSEWVSQFCSIAKSCQLLAQNLFTLPIERVSEVRDGLLIFVRYLVSGFRYVDKMDQDLSLPFFHESCRALFKQYHNQGAKLAVRIRDNISKHLGRNGQMAEEFVCQLIEMISRFAIEQNTQSEKDQALHFLYNIERCVIHCHRAGYVNQNRILPLLNNRIECLNKRSVLAQPFLPSPLPVEEVTLPKKSIFSEIETLAEYLNKENLLKTLNPEGRAKCLKRLMRDDKTPLNPNQLAQLEQSVDGLLALCNQHTQEYEALAAAYLQYVGHCRSMGDETCLSKSVIFLATELAKALSRGERKKHCNPKFFIRAFDVFPFIDKTVFMNEICRSNELSLNALNKTKMRLLLQWMMDDCSQFSQVMLEKAACFLEKLPEMKSKFLIIASQKVAAKDRTFFEQIFPCEPEVPVAAVIQEQIVEENIVPVPVMEQNAEEKGPNPLEEAQRQTASLMKEGKWLEALGPIQEMESLGTAINQEVKRRREQVARGYSELWLSEYDFSSDYMAVIERFENYERVQGNVPLDIAVYERVVLLYYVVQKPLLCFLVSVKLVQLIAKNAANKKMWTAPPRTVLSERVSAARQFAEQIRASDSYALPIKRYVDQVEKELINQKWAILRQPASYPFQEKLSALQQLMDQHPPQEQPTKPADKVLELKNFEALMQETVADGLIKRHHVLVNLADCFVRNEKWKEAFEYSKQAVALYVSEGAILVFCKVAKQLGKTQEFVDMFWDARRRGMVLTQFNDALIPLLMSVLFFEHHSVTRHWPHLARSFLLSGISFYRMCTADLSAFTPQEQKEKRMVYKRHLISSYDALSCCFSEVQPTFPDLKSKCEAISRSLLRNQIQNLPAAFDDLEAYLPQS